MDHQYVLADHGQAALLFGGWNGGNDASSCFGDVWRSHPNGTDWERVTAAAPWGTRRSHMATTLRASTGDETVIMIGGLDGGNYGSTTKGGVWATTDVGESWKQILDDGAAFGKRYSAGLTTIHGGSTAVLCAGSSSAFTLFDDCWSSDDGAKWTQVGTDLPFGKRRLHQLAAQDGTLLLMGGLQYPEGSSQSQYMSDVWASSDGGTTWAEVTAAAQWRTRTDFIAMSLPSGQVAIYGGYEILDYEDYVLSDVWITQAGSPGANWFNFGFQHAPLLGRNGARGIACPDGSITIVGGKSGLYSTAMYHSDAVHGVFVS